MQSNDYLSHYQNKKGIKACENMGRLYDNLFYAQEKSHKHWLLSLDNLGLRTARRGRIHNLGFRTARRGRIHNLGFRTARRGRIHNPGLRTARRGRIYNLGLRTACGRRIHNLGLRTACERRIYNLGFRTACGRRIQKKHPRVSPKGPSPQTTKHGDRHKRTVPVCPPRVSCSCLSAFYHAKIFSIFTKKVKGVQKCSWWTLFLQMK